MFKTNALLFTLLSFLAVGHVGADELRDSLFASANAALKDANNELSKVLAPVSYAEGARLYASADRRYKKGHKVARVEVDLSGAVKNFRIAIKASKVAQVSFKTTIQARTDAKGVDAEKLAAKTWEKAEAKFMLATKTLETGSRSRAEARVGEAEKLYRDAELIAIKGNYLNQTRAKIEEADRLKVKKFAPKTLDKATRLLAAAEKELSENRYDTDYPRALVKEAYYEARHALYLAKQLEALKKKELTPEDLILKHEEPVAAVAGELDVVAEFDKGFEAPVQVITTQIQKLQKDSYDLGELQTKTAALEQDFAALEQKFGVHSQRLKQQEEAQERLQRITEYFRRNEASVLTQGENVLVRMVGLNFEPGSAQIVAANYGLLQKVENAIRMYPGYTVVIEGHTDSFGSTESNQSLSEDRAKAVRQYLLVNMNDLPASRCEAYGYGESRPVANNETREGRKRNRRIDVLLKPLAEG
ncbi:OmpA family protein [Teredinibacter franksiae]|uniref:OmpA family protein n=1 Tax=Teredinibacter franksiae TaxID=2761453 RepID=UPI00162AD951|nr:OmpA family protein [Teredinibacter franksiae]